MLERVCITLITWNPEYTRDNLENKMFPHPLEVSYLPSALYPIQILYAALTLISITDILWNVSIKDDCSPSCIHGITRIVSWYLFSRSNHSKTQLELKTCRKELSHNQKELAIKMKEFEKIRKQHEVIKFNSTGR